MNYKFGYFNDEGSEFIVTDPATPRAFDNFLWNDSLFSCIEQTGTGYIDYQVANHEAVQLFTGVGRICDFDIFGRDGLMNRLIYIRDNDTGNFWNLNWEPVKREFENFRCTHGLGYSIIQSTVNDICSSLRIMVPPGKDPVELWTLKFDTVSIIKRNLSIFVYNQVQFSYKWGFNSYGDMFFRRSWFDKSNNWIISRKKPHISPHDFQTCVLTSNEPIVSFDGSRDFFVGRYNHVNEPVAVIKGICSGTEGSSDSTIMAAQFDCVIQPGETKNIEIVLLISDSEDNALKIKEKYLGKAADQFAMIKQRNKEFINYNHVITPDAQLNKLVNIWIKHQTSFGARWCRWGWMGFRDIVQHGYGVSSFNPQRTKEILSEAFGYQFNSGMAVRGWNPVDEKPYSDSALWLVFTLISYLKETCDTGFLNEQIPYYDKGNGTVLEHIENALNFLEKNKGQHQLCLIKYGDWNDSLTGVGKRGKGESVWLSMAYAEALRQMAELCRFIKLDKKSDEYLERYKVIGEAINSNAWDGKWYVRCFDDDGLPVGSDKNHEGKIFLNAQSWALISGVAGHGNADKIIESAETLLKTGMGYRLLYPTFREFDPQVGRISCMEPGICENGTIYSHVNAWYILGLIRAGKPDKAYETFKLISPGYPSSLPGDPKQNMPPYIFANGYYGPDHRNNKLQMEFTWITGSVAWYYNVILKEMIGIQPDYDCLVINPSIPSDWEKVSAVRSFRNKHFNIELVRDNSGNKGLFLNGNRLPSNSVRLDEALDTNEIRYYL